MVAPALVVLLFSLATGLVSHRRDDQWSIGNEQLVLDFDGGSPTYSLHFNSSNSFYVKVSIDNIFVQNMSTGEIVAKVASPVDWRHSASDGPLTLNGTTISGVSAVTWTNVSFANASSLGMMGDGASSSAVREPMMISQFFVLDGPSPSNLTASSLPLPQLMPLELRDAKGSAWDERLQLNKRSSVIVRTIALNMPVQRYPGDVRFGVETHMKSNVGPFKVSYSRYPEDSTSKGHFKLVGLQGGHYKVETHLPPNGTVFCDGRKRISVFHPKVKVTSITDPVASDAYMRWDSLETLFPNASCDQTAWMFTLYITLEPSSSQTNWIILGCVVGGGVALVILISCGVVMVWFGYRKYESIQQSKLQDSDDGGVEHDLSAREGDMEPLLAH